MSKPQLTNPTNEQELREQITPLVIEAIKDDLDTWHFMHSVITAHANAEIAKVLERLEAELNEQKKAAETNLAYHVDVTKNERLIRDWQGTVHGIEFCRPAIAAERAKLKEMK